MNWNITNFLQYVLIIIHVLTIMSLKQSHGTEIKSKMYVGNNNKHTHTHPLNGRFSGTTQVSRYQRGKTNQDFTEARDSEWQWNPLSAPHSRQITMPAAHHSVTLNESWKGQDRNKYDTRMTRCGQLNGDSAFISRCSV